MKASEIATIVRGTLQGRADPVIDAVAPLSQAGARDLSFLAHPRYISYLAESQAGVILIAEALADRVDEGVVRIVVKNVHAALADVLPHLQPPPQTAPGIAPTAVIGSGTRPGTGSTIEDYAVIGADVRLGSGVHIGAHAVVGDGCELSDDVVVHAHATLYAGVRIGARSIIHSGARLGVDGFGYVTEKNRHRRIPQVGGCLIGADVEIGANVTVDRGSIGPTQIGDGVKIDNLVHIGHNVRIGENSMIIAQVGISGSARIGKGVTLGGQAGLAGHIEIGDGAVIAAQSGVFGDVPAGGVYSGYPARPHKEALRAQASVSRLPGLLKRLRILEQRLLGRKGEDR